MNLIRMLTLLAAAFVATLGLSSTAVAEGSFVGTGTQVGADDTTATPQSDCGQVTGVNHVSYKKNGVTTDCTLDDYQVIHPRTGNAYVVFFQNHQPPKDATVTLEGTTSDDGPHAGTVTMSK